MSGPMYSVSVSCYTDKAHEVARFMEAMSRPMAALAIEGLAVDMACELDIDDDDESEDEEPT